MDCSPFEHMEMSTNERSDILCGSGFRSVLYRYHNLLAETNKTKKNGLQLAPRAPRTKTQRRQIDQQRTRLQTHSTTAGDI